VSHVAARLRFLGDGGSRSEARGTALVCFSPLGSGLRLAPSHGWPRGRAALVAVSGSAGPG